VGVRLVDLEPQFVRLVDGFKIQDVATIQEAQGVRFNCPLSNGPTIIAWFRNRGVPDDACPRGGRWEVSGTDYSDLTLSPSIDLSCGGKYTGQWHGFVQNREIR